ncbi:MAG TPA: hypothetical protein VI423_07575, partial [Paenisporosarcina sp.]|nr:hypothetical protein [Paenisporosarcina sp.]
VDVHEELRCYEVPTINLDLDFNKIALQHAAIGNILNRVLSRRSCIKGRKNVGILLGHYLLPGLLDSAINYVESTTLYLGDTNGWVRKQLELGNGDALTKDSGLSSRSIAGDDNCCDINIPVIDG